MYAITSQVPFYHQQPLLHRPSARHQQPNGDHSQRDGPHFVQQNPSRDNDHFVGHSQSSGYSSTEVTGGSAASSRDSKLPLPQPDKSPPTRDSWVSLSDQASHIHYYSYCTVYQTGLSSQQTEMARHDGSTFFPSPVREQLLSSLVEWTLKEVCVGGGVKVGMHAVML